MIFIPIQILWIQAGIYYLAAYLSAIKRLSTNVLSKTACLIWRKPKKTTGSHFIILKIEYGFPNKNIFIIDFLFYCIMVEWTKLEKFYNRSGKICWRTTKISYSLFQKSTEKNQRNKIKKKSRQSSSITNIFFKEEILNAKLLDDLFNR